MLWLKLPPIENVVNANMLVLIARLAVVSSSFLAVTVCDHLLVREAKLLVDPSHYPED
jgi:hypothetical protein